MDNAIAIDDDNVEGLSEVAVEFSLDHTNERIVNEIVAMVLDEELLVNELVRRLRPAPVAVAI